MSKQKQRAKRLDPLVREIIVFAEYAYRRGYQHGHHFVRHPKHRIPSSYDVAMWRFSKSRWRYAVWPPHERWMYRQPLIERAFNEIQSDGFPLLFQLFSKYYPPRAQKDTAQ
jgi:hypothetical protein